MRFRDYLALAASEKGPAAKDAEQHSVEQFSRFLESQKISAAAVQAWLDAPVAAKRDAPRVHGKFPVILIAQGNFAAAYAQSALAEFLASHGYIVATTPSPSRLTGPISSDGGVLPMARDQAADLLVAPASCRHRLLPVSRTMPSSLLVAGE